ncbi:LuxR C-terminal-related transcriptional regulator [Paenibacillus sp.]|uniref:LuxR C-terminal-related transcriptional regulator n=1 Tax=Paenibacillus sp. TaxID=58172 RepID=UPI00281172F2|nr:LuxR C-terminal-related transcriptional regulator [Paenibacillus sp.]
MIASEAEKEWDSRAFVGRKRELSVFEALQSKLPASRQLLNVYATGGMGKSFLLDEFEKRAKAAGGATVVVDSVGFVRTPDAFCSRLLEALAVPANRGAEETRLLNDCVDALTAIADARPLYLFIDTYEHMEGLDQWLRESFLKRLGNNVMIVIAGRYPLSEAWRISPAWGRCLTRLPLAELDAASVERYAEYMHIFDRDAVSRLRSASRGHPLTMSLLAFLYASPGSPEFDANAEAGLSAEADGYETLAYVVNRWLEEVPDGHLRPFVEAAAVLRQFHQESLSYVMEREITASEFYQLIRFSFIRKVDRGWALHGLMREMVNRELLSRTPERYERIRQRAMQYYYAKMTESNESGGGDARDGVEIMYYIGDSLIRAFMNWFDTAPLRFFPAGPEDRGTLEAYVRRRKAESREARIEVYDPSSDRRFAFGLTARETTYTVQKIDFDALFALGYDIVRILRNAAGAMLGFAVVIPINEKTLPYLRQAPRSKAYFSSLSPAMTRRLSVPSDYRAGWFIETIDTADYEDPAQQSAMGYLLHDLIFSGELVVESPAPTVYFIEAHKSLGFEIADCPAHTEYDGETPAPTFVIDRQGEYGLDYVHRMLRLTGQTRVVEQASEAAAGAQAKADAPPAADRIAGRPELTPREKEVAKLLEQGLKNAEIAAALFVSEVTAKKHLRAMMAKLGAKNRTQLLKRLLE